MTTEARRVLIFAGCFADAAPAVPLASLLAREMRAALIGILTREPALEFAAGAPVLSSRPRRGVAGVLSAEALDRAFAADARAFGAVLARAATGASLRWELRTDSGICAELAWRDRRPGDLVLLGHRRLVRMKGPVVSVGGPGDDATATLARSVAAALGLRARSLENADPAAIEALSATALIVGPDLARQTATLLALIEAARCPVMIAPDPTEAASD